MSGCGSTLARLCSRPFLLLWGVSGSRSAPFGGRAESRLSGGLGGVGVAAGGEPVPSPGPAAVHRTDDDENDLLDPAPSRRASIASGESLSCLELCLGVHAVPFTCVVRFASQLGPDVVAARPVLPSFDDPARVSRRVRVLVHAWVNAVSAARGSPWARAMRGGSAEKQRNSSP